jgi:hypothetical protein
MFILYSNNAVKGTSEKTTRSELNHLNSIIDHICKENVVPMLQGEYLEYLDIEIDEQGKCRFEILSLVDEIYKKYFKNIRERLDLKGVESNQSDLEILELVKQFTIRYKTHSLLIPHYLTKIEFKMPVTDKIVDCALCMDVSKFDVIILKISCILRN